MRVVQRRADEPGTQAVHADAVPAELDRHRPGELQHAALRRVVVREAPPPRRARSWTPCSRSRRSRARPSVARPPAPPGTSRAGSPAGSGPTPPRPSRGTASLCAIPALLMSTSIDPSAVSAASTSRATSSSRPTSHVTPSTDPSGASSAIVARTSSASSPQKHDAAPLLQEPADGGLPDAAAPAGDQHRLVGQAAHRVPRRRRRARTRVDTMPDMRGMVADVARASKGVRSSRGNRRVKRATARTPAFDPRSRSTACSSSSGS